MAVVTVTVGSDVVNLNYTPPTLPYPVVQYTSLTRTGDTGNVVAIALNRLTGPSIVQFPAGIFEFIDFQIAFSAAAFQGYGYYSQNLRGVIGADVVDAFGNHTNQTIIRVKANTMGTTVATAGMVMPTAAGQTNNFQIIRFGVGTSIGNVPAYISNITFQATPQAAGLFYNGVYLWYTTNSTFQYVLIQGIPGGPGPATSSPPSENFGINDNHGINNTYTWVEVDGRDPITHTPVTSSGFGTNSCTGISRSYCYAHDCGGGAGFTSFQNSNFDFHYCRAINNAKAGFNFERMSGTLDLDHCTATGNGNEIILDSDQSSTKTTIENWIGNITGVVHILIHPTYSWPPGTANPNKQLPNPNAVPAFSGPSDVTVTPSSSAPLFVT